MPLFTHASIQSIQAPPCMCHVYPHSFKGGLKGLRLGLQVEVRTGFRLGVGLGSGLGAEECVVSYVLYYFPGRTEI